MRGPQLCLSFPNPRTPTFRPGPQGALRFRARVRLNHRVRAGTAPAVIVAVKIHGPMPGIVRIKCLGDTGGLELTATDPPRTLAGFALAHELPVTVKSPVPGVIHRQRLKAKLHVALDPRAPTGAPLLSRYVRFNRFARPYRNNTQMRAAPRPNRQRRKHPARRRILHTQHRMHRRQRLLPVHHDQQTRALKPGNRPQHATDLDPHIQRSRNLVAFPDILGAHRSSPASTRTVAGNAGATGPWPRVRESSLPSSRTMWM